MLLFHPGNAVVFISLMIEMNSSLWEAENEQLLRKARRCDFDQVYSTGFSPLPENLQRFSSLLWKLSKPRSVRAVKLAAVCVMASHSS